MLRLGAEAAGVEPDERSAPKASFEGRQRRCRASVAGHLRQPRPETSWLMLFRAGPKSYSASEPSQQALNLRNVGWILVHPFTAGGNCEYGDGSGLLRNRRVVSLIALAFLEDRTGAELDA
jgi:hypothetical protein